MTGNTNIWKYLHKLINYVNNIKKEFNLASNMNFHFSQATELGELRLLSIWSLDLYL